MPFPVASGEYAAGTEPARAQFEGVLNFQAFRSRARMKILTDNFGVTKTKNLQLKYLPDFKLTLVQDGQALISVIRSAQRTRHPYWEFIAGTGGWTYPGPRFQQPLTDATNCAIHVNQVNNTDRTLS